MKIRPKPKKSLSEFCTARETTMKPINLITSGYRFSIQNDNEKIKYVSNVMNRTKSKQELSSDNDKYRILAGKLHVFNFNKEVYLPIQNNFHVDLSRLTRRMKNDSIYNIKSARTTTSSLNLQSSENGRLNGIKTAQNFMPNKKNLSRTSQSWQVQGLG